MADQNWRSNVIATAREWIGTPYHHKGRVKGVGVDCGGLLHSVYGQVFPLAPFPRTYAPDWAVHRDNEIYLEWIEPYVYEISKPIIGGMVLARYGRNYSHAGIYTERDTVIHAYGRSNRGAVCETTIANMRRGNPVKFFDVRTQWLS